MAEQCGRTWCLSLRSRRRALENWKDSGPGHVVSPWLDLFLPDFLRLL